LNGRTNMEHGSFMEPNQQALIIGHIHCFILGYKKCTIFLIPYFSFEIESSMLQFLLRFHRVLDLTSWRFGYFNVSLQLLLRCWNQIPFFGNQENSIRFQYWIQSITDDTKLTYSDF
jgi:hypothetical protein